MKYRITLEIETRPFTADELAQEGESGDVGMIDDMVPMALARSVADAMTMPGFDDEMFAGSDTFQKLVNVGAVSAEAVR